jgi:hypothetical protein
MMFVHDPTVYEIHFFAIPPDREAPKREAMRDFVNTAVQQFAKGVNATPPYQVLQLEHFAEEFTDPLSFVGPTEIAPGATVELDARTLHDTVMLRTTAERKGKFELENVKALDFSTPLPQPSKLLPGYLGAFRVLYAETDKQERPKRAQVGKALAAAFGWTWLAEAEPIVTPIGTMLFGVQRLPLHRQHDAPALDLIFVGGRDAAEISERYPLHPFLFTLPELALCHLKVRNSASNIRFDWLKQVAQRERELRDLLPLRGEDDRDLQKMLGRNDDLTARQAELVDAVAHVESELRTMRINRDNFAAAARPFRRVAVKLQHLLIDRWMRGTELQAENDIGYIQGTLRRAENHVKSIEASAEVQQARALRRINATVIVLGLVQTLIAAAALVVAIRSMPSSPPAPSPIATEAAAKAR